MLKACVRALPGLFAVMIALGMSVSWQRASVGSAWRLEMAQAANAEPARPTPHTEPPRLTPAGSTDPGTCEYPPQDEPDDDGDECSPGYQQQVAPSKNLGAGGDPDCPICTKRGDPINYATGSFFEEEDDYAGAGRFPVALKRYYNSQDAGAHGFGVQWRGTYSRSLATTSATTVQTTRDDGSVFTFTLVKGVWTPDSDVNVKLTQTASGWIYVSALDEVETYNAGGQLRSIASRAGLTKTFAYDAQGRLGKATDPFGRALTFTYASPTSPLIAQVSGPDGGVYVYAYDSQNRLVSVTHPDNSKRQYVYENASFPNFLTGVVDEDGARFATIAYDSTGRAISSQHAGGADLTQVDYTYVSLGVITITNAIGGHDIYLLQGVNGSAKQLQTLRNCSNCPSSVGAILNDSYDANGNVTQVTDFNGNVTSHVYDLTRNLEISRTLASGETITTAWSPAYRLPIRIQEPNRLTSFVYDAHGNLLGKTIAALGTTPGASTWSYTYNGQGQPLTANDPDGHVTRYAYDAQGDLASVTNALGQVTAFTRYDANGRPLSITDPNGMVTTVTYNFRGQVTSLAARQLKTTNAYDPAGQLIKQTKPDGAYLGFTYDAAHRLTGVADALGDTIVYTLDAAGNRTQEQVFDPKKTLTRTHSRVYDGFSRLVQDIGAQNQTSTAYYDQNDNLTSVYDPNNFQTSMSFDRLNRPSSLADAYYHTTNLTYDAMGRLYQVRDPRGLTTTYADNPLDEPQATTSPDTGATTRTYDAAGNVLTSTDARGVTTTFAYDALNRMTRQSPAGSTTITFQYDQGAFGLGHLTAMSDATGVTRWTYDPFGRVVSRQQTAGGRTLTTLYAYGAANGHLLSMTYPSGAVTSYVYDRDGRVSAIQYTPAGGGTARALVSNIAYQPFGPVRSWTAGNGASYSRAYDQDGRIAAISMPAGEAISLSYDPGSRITAMTDTKAPAKAFTYDAVNRLNGYTVAGVTQTYTYDADGNRLSYADNAATPLSLTYSYDSNSNHLLSISGGSTETYGYDAAGEVDTHQTPATSFAFAYDGRGRMIQGAVGAAVEAYGVNGLGQRLTKTPSGGGATTFAYDEAGQMIGRYDTTVGHEETVFLGDLPVALIEPTAALYIAPDNLGAPHQITDGARNIIWLWIHGPFGNSQSSGSLTSYRGRFPGQFADSETGLYYNYFRDYEPGTGRYVESDPIGLEGGINTYDYVANSPIHLSDLLALAYGPPNQNDPWYHYRDPTVGNSPDLTDTKFDPKEFIGELLPTAGHEVGVEVGKGNVTKNLIDNPLIKPEIRACTAGALEFSEPIGWAVLGFEVFDSFNKATTVSPHISYIPGYGPLPGYGYGP